MPTLPALPPRTYTRFDPTQGYKQTLYHAARGLQSAELNETQDASNYERQAHLDAAYGDGAMIAGGAISYVSTAATTASWVVGKGTFYALKFLYELPESDFTIAQPGDPAFPLGETDAYGVIIHVDVVDETVDPLLRDPAPGTKNYGEAGASRMRYIARFGKQSTAEADDWFYHRIDFVNGQPTTGGGNADPGGIADLIARYDRNANGNYIVRGNYVSYLGDDPVANTHRLQLSEGQSNVYGYEQVISYPQSLTTPFAQGVKQVLAEPLTFASDGVYVLRNSPIAGIGPQVNGIVETTQSVVHGAFQGAIDQLPNTPVVSVSRVIQAATTYVPDVDYRQTGDRITWLTGGNEPSPGSTYQVTFRYSSTFTPAATSDRLGITLAGLAPQTVVYVDYTYYVPRYDILVVNQGREYSVIQGVPSPNPVPPTISAGLILATLYVSYGFPPRITNSDQRRPLTSDLVTVQHSIDDIKYNLARLDLNDRLRTSDPVTLMKGIFADPMLDDTYRDAGIAQTAEVAAGICYMQVPWTYSGITDDTVLAYRVILPYTTTVLAENLAHSTSFQINQFVGVAAPPATVVTWPAEISWLAEDVTRAVRSSPYYIPYWAIGGVPPGIPYPGPPGSPLNVKGDIRIVATTVSEDMITTPVKVPQTVIHFAGLLFNRAEPVNVQFDSVTIGTVQADTSGHIAGSFTTPASTLSGTKKITFKGQVSGVAGQSSFTAIPFKKETTEYLQQIVYYDPLAETYGPTENAFVTDVSAWIQHDPANPPGDGDFIDCLLLETELGLPDRSNTIASARLYNPDIPDAGLSHVPAVFRFPQPVATGSDRQYAVVLATPNPSYRAWGCSLGQYDTTFGRWISAKPTTGTLLESSNTVTWVPRLKDDLTYIVNQAVFSESLAHTYPAVAVSDATDLTLLANIDTPPGTSVKFTAMLTVGGQSVFYPITPNAPVSIPLYSGPIVISALLSTTNPSVTPAIDPNVSLAVATVTNPSTYVTRAIPVPAGQSAAVTTLKVYLEIYEPNPNTVLVEYLAADGSTWTPFVRDVLNATSIGFGIVDMPFIAPARSMVGASQTRIRITLNSLDATLLRRSYCRNLRMYYA